VPNWLHLGLMWVHIASGMVALAAGTAAVAARKGGRAHRSAGTWFFAAMLTLGITASILEPFRSPTPGSPLAGFFVVYFVLTSWVSARRHDGRTGWFEMVACAVALGLAAATTLGGLSGSTTPAGRGPLFVLAAFCLFAGLLDLHAVLRRQLSAAQRISRHLWRMCVAFFIATGSFFLGQQDVMPPAVRGSPILFAFALAPFAVMIWWLVRLRFAKAMARLTFRPPPALPAGAAASAFEMET